MSSTWRWRVAADPPDDGRSPPANVIPFARKAGGPSPQAQGDVPSPAEVLVREALAEAVRDSDWGRTWQEDREALEDERAFRRRFGFTVNREQRRKTLELKRDMDLTDPEIRRLRWSGSLDLKSEPAKVRASNFVRGFGYAMIVLVCLQMLLGILAVVRADSLTVTSLVAITLIEAVLVCMLSAAYYVYVEPSQIHARLRK